ncbi:MAG: glucose 1-dehydrogenase [candidate division KSB1 bacterium]|nr:glucose 1-dehydrogenase [candidate division KSB1 bacterium]
MGGSSRRLEGKRILITGASTGIGKACAIRAAQEGAAVVGVNYASHGEAARETAAEVERAGARAILLRADVSAEAEATRLVAEFVTAAGGLEILVNNAGALLQRHSIEDMPTELWRRVFALNVDGTFFVTRAALPYLKRNGGAIVNITSVAAYTGGGPGSVHYASAKGAVVTFTIGLAKELSPYGIRVNAVAPGPIATPFHERFSSPEQIRQFEQATLLRRLGTPEEVAEAVIFLASEAASYITGATIDVNGGMYFR